MKKAQKVALGLISVIVIAAGVIFYRGYGQERTDDAQVDGHIISISSRVTGQVQKVLVRDNEMVKKGQPLVELDSNEVAARLAAARADLSAAEAALTGSQSDVAAALSRLRLAELERERVRKLFQEGVLAQAEVDTRQSQFDQAKAAYDQAVARLGAGKTEGGTSAGEKSATPVGAALARVQQAEAAYKLAEVNASYTTITAPVDGVVSRRAVEEGQMVAPLTPLMALVDLNDIWVVANFKEDQLSDMKIGQAVTIKIDSYPELKLEGELGSIAAATGAKFALIPPDNATGNFVKVVQRIPVLIRFKDRKNADSARVLRPGMSATVSVRTL